MVQERCDDVMFPSMVESSPDGSEFGGLYSEMMRKDSFPTVIAAAALSLDVSW